eukprot:66929-Rhodomonas_salina.1
MEDTDGAAAEDVTCHASKGRSHHPYQYSAIPALQYQSCERRTRRLIIIPTSRTPFRKPQYQRRLLSTSVQELLAPYRRRISVLASPVLVDGRLRSVLASLFTLAYA